MSSLLLSWLLTGTFEFAVGLGGVTPIGGLELNHQGGMSGSVAMGYRLRRSFVEFGAELGRLSGRYQADYYLTNCQLSIAYHYALVNRITWQLRSGFGADWNLMTRRQGSVSEHGSVLSGSLVLSWIRSFGHPRFLVQLSGTELVEPALNGAAATTGTLVGAKLGFGYEF